MDRRPETQFVIGASREFEATMSGQLACFANDLRLFDFNNSGCVMLTVEPVGE